MAHREDEKEVCRALREGERSSGAFGITLLLYSYPLLAYLLFVIKKKLTNTP